MVCPRCKQVVENNLSICPNCGKKLVMESVLDGEIIYFQEDITQTKINRLKKILAVIVPLLVAAGIASAIYYFTTHPSNPQSSEAAAETTQTAVVEQTEAPAPQNAAAATAAVTAAAQESKAPQTQAASHDDAEKLIEYADSIGLVKTLKETADEKTTASVKAEDSTLIAHYRVDADSEDGANKEYFDSLKDKYEELAANLDRTVYEMKQNSGVSNATIEIIVIDSKGKNVFSRVID